MSLADHNYPARALHLGREDEDGTRSDVAHAGNHKTRHRATTKKRCNGAVICVLCLRGAGGRSGLVGYAVRSQVGGVLFAGCHELDKMTIEWSASSGVTRATLWFSSGLAPTMRLTVTLMSAYSA